jgi:hypothetical protein
MTKMEERAVKLLDTWESTGDTEKWIRDFAEWSGKYSRFGYDMRDVFVETTIAEMFKRGRL